MAGRIVVLISGTGSNLAALVRACGKEVPGVVSGVAADRDCPGLDIARGNHIPTVVVRPSSWADRHAWSLALLQEVQELEPDLVVSAGFMRLLAPVFVDALAGRLVNVHPSLLPSFPGRHAVRDALAAGVAVTGTTIHLVDHGCDTGPVLLQERVPVLPGDDESTLHERIKEVEHRLLPRACASLLRSLETTSSSVELRA
jgi:phosphoribosylglycinamide formyltransferase 1